MDGANSDNESRSTSSFPDDPPFLEVLSRKKRKKKRWEFNPELPIPVTRSSSSSVPPSPNDQFAGVECGVANNATIQDSRSSSPPSPSAFSFFFGTIH
ncbi:hypothetical protein HPP92_017530 [Vanilla planifolia]|uniref:Uncharacterized protein n=1 Tax=Vanilla planifolia TaxID=51239 RepID=A0A835UNI5_VANPL|nr:hypothetical protein HPP92_017530 [Vanilla planifolia]